MPAASGTLSTTIRAIPYPAENDPAAVWKYVEDVAKALDAAAFYDQGTTVPVSGKRGDVFKRTGDKSVWLHDGTSWQEIRRGEGVQALTATASMSAEAGRMSTFAGASGQTITAPPAIAGDDFELLNIDTADSFTLSRAGSDVLASLGTTQTTITVPAGMRIRGVCVVTGQWELIQENVPLVATLPATPFDGMEVRYQPSALATAGIVWGFRYRSGASTNKWEAVGAPTPLRSNLLGVAGATAATYSAISGAPTITVPLGGNYDVVTQGKIQAASTGYQGGWVAPSGAGITAVDVNAISMAMDAAGGPFQVLTREVTLGLTAAGTLTVQGKSRSGTNATFYDLELAIRPRAVA